MLIYKIYRILVDLIFDILLKDSFYSVYGSLRVLMIHEQNKIFIKRERKIGRLLELFLNELLALF